MSAPASDEPAAVVVDNSEADRLPTGKVYVRLNDPDLTDREIADAAGLCHRHFGYAVYRNADRTGARVDLWND